MRATDPHETTEQGFTMVEILVVLVIISIITAIAVMSLRSTQANGIKLQIRASAVRYADAVVRFQSDHGRKVPVWNSADWRASAANAGPIATYTVGSTVSRTTYLKGAAPEIMTRPGPVSSRGRFASAAPPSTSKGGVLVYKASASGFGFTIEAYADGKLLCAAGDTPPGVQDC